MKKLTVAVPRAETDGLLSRLMRLRAVSLTVASEQTQTERVADNGALAAAAARVARVEEVLPALTKCARRKKSLFQPVIPVSMETFRAGGRAERAWKTVDETKKVLDGIAAARAEAAEYLAEEQALSPYLDLDISLDTTGTDSTRMICGNVTAGLTAETVAASVEGLGAVIEIVQNDPTGVYLAAIYHKTQEEDVLRALSSLGFLRASFRHTAGTPKQLFDEAERRRAQARQTEERLSVRLSSLAENLTDVEILCDLERTAMLTAEQKKNLAETGACTVLTGWCPAAAEERVCAIAARYDAACEFEDPAEEDDPPVLLQNNAYARNFEWVLGMYSYPKYGKFDPTFIMSIFYFIIFGLMFADAGYGVLLVLACFGAVRWLKPREGMKRFLLMFGYCGISCIIWGVLFGAYFGNFPLAFMENVLGRAPEAMPRLGIFSGEEANIAVLFDPLQNPMTFLIISLGVGAVHLVAGMAVKFVLLCREGKAFDALCDIGSYWLLFAGIGVVMVQKTAGLILLGLGAAAIVATQGRHAPKIAGKITGGLLGLYGLINYASDLLSYSRILALGLAAGVIGQVVNILATLKGASFIGFFLMIVVFCVGHLLNLVINILGTFVHTSRLQYIEFFGKFYEDGGTPFRPMAPADKYTENTDPVCPAATTEP